MERVFLYLPYFYRSAQDVRIGIGGFAQKVLVVGLYREQRGVDS